MRRLLAAGRSDVGRVRTSNEDALLVADSVFAVADGMGGHVAGEVAASTALEPLTELDGKVFADSNQAIEALRNAVVAANETVSQMASEDPNYRGMGTTLTALLLEGQRVHLAHVGDSRAYLLRDGQFSQMTDDHTLVQHLIDEGQLTREQAANHPQRSVITRAIGVSPQVDVDSMTLELQPDDVLLLCSDGLTGVVDDETIAMYLRERMSPEETIDRLIALANSGGGPDNITVILLRYEDSEAPARTAPPKTVPIRTRDSDDAGDWVSTVGAIGAFGSGSRLAPGNGDADDTPSYGRLVARSVAVMFGVAVLIGVLFAGGRFLLSQSYFVGVEDDYVVIYQGVDVEFGPINLARVHERTDVSLGDIPAWYHPTLEAGRPAADINDARRIVQGIPRRDADDADSASG
ncbi:MAG: Stp1/IreP family PP2C-type Ser/Thr phosphatase [Nitriliruptoraceae bacterium]